jgi:hypothetical protein
MRPTGRHELIAGQPSSCPERLRLRRERVRLADAATDGARARFGSYRRISWSLGSLRLRVRVAFIPSNATASTAKWRDTPARDSARPCECQWRFRTTRRCGVLSRARRAVPSSATAEVRCFTAASTCAHPQTSPHSADASRVGRVATGMLARLPSSAAARIASIQPALMPIRSYAQDNPPNPTSPTTAAAAVRRTASTPRPTGGETIGAARQRPCGSRLGGPRWAGHACLRARLKRSCRCPARDPTGKRGWLEVSPIQSQASR